MDYISGEIFVIDKPLGWTSFDVVKRLRGALTRLLGLKRFKVGHAGTLDPLASGVLVICTGRATRQIESIQAGRKVYEATVRLGESTPSYDLETEIDRTAPTAHITRELVEEVLSRFRGRIMQVPPVFSAVKVDGKRAYRYARKGAEVELAAKPVEISSLELLEYGLPDIRLRIECGKGTYIRSLARDLGEALGTCAHLTSLRRLRVGSHDISGALTPGEAVELIASSPVSFPEGYPVPPGFKGILEE